MTTVKGTDGGCANQSGYSWSDAWHGTDPTDDTNDIIHVRYYCTLYTGFYIIRRGYLAWDLSAIPSGSSVDTIIVRLYAISFAPTSGAPTMGRIGITEGRHEPPFTGADYTAYGVVQTPFATVLTGIVDAYNDFELNTAGVAYVKSKFGGMLYLGLRTQPDYAYDPSGHRDIQMRIRPGHYTGYEPLLVLSPYMAYPSDSITRVTGLHHIYNPGMYRLEIQLGDVSNTIEIVERAARKKIEEIPEPVVPEPWPEPVPPRIPEPFPDVVPWPEETKPPTIEEIRAGREAGKKWTPIYGGGLVGGLGTLPGLADYRKKKLAEEQAAKAAKAAQPSLWSKMTPWKEEKGETFVSAIKKIFKKPPKPPKPPDSYSPYFEGF